MSKKLLINVESKIFSTNSIETVAEIKGDVFEIRQELVKPLYTGHLDPIRKVQRILYSQSVSRIASFSRVGPPHSKLNELIVNLSDGSSELITNFKMEPNWSTDHLQQFIDPNFLIKLAFFLCNSQGRIDYSAMISIAIFKNKLIFSLPKDGNLAFSGEALEVDENFLITTYLTKDIRFAIEVFDGDIEKFEVIKKQTRTASVALFTPLPVIAALIPPEKLRGTMEIDNRVFEIKISGNDFQILAYAGGGINYDMLLTTQRELQKAIIRFGE